ncbi:MAG: DUF2007 domain-containing protein [Desulfobacteraceae bacterium]|nr:DUF2007 domain-containing protein [Desulfobacteraceae bacterium]
MFCPICKCEYREGFTECSDCKTQLVAEFPTDKKPVSIKYKEVTSNLRHDDIIVIKSILEANGIIFSVQGELFGAIRGVPSTIRLMVQESQYEDTLELLKDFM